MHYVWNLYDQNYHFALVFREARNIYGNAFILENTLWIASERKICKMYSCVELRY